MKDSLQVYNEVFTVKQKREIVCRNYQEGSIYFNYKGKLIGINFITIYFYRVECIIIFNSQNTWNKIGLLIQVTAVNKLNTLSG